MDDAAKVYAEYVSIDPVWSSNIFEVPAVYAITTIPQKLNQDRPESQDDKGAGLNAEILSNCSERRFSRGTRAAATVALLALLLSQSPYYTVGASQDSRSIFMTADCL